MKNLYKKLNPELKKRLKKIRLLILDFDGSLTDNKVYVDQEGRESVRADRGDGFGLELLRKHTEVKAVILSKETNPVTAARARKLKIPCTHGIEDKLSNFLREIKHYQVNAEEVCFAGNDLNDIECLKKAGVGIAVADSYPQVLEIADYVTARKGGEGAVREICELILYAKNSHPFG